MTIILDLDYTLLDTEGFKTELAAAFVRCGVPEGRYRQTYRTAVRTTFWDYDYDIERHMRLVEREIDCPREAFREEVEGAIATVRDHLYPGAEAFVKRLRGRGAKVILLTLGNVDWQRKKVELSGIVDLFDEVVYTSDDKAALVEKFAEEDPPVWIVNDNGGEVMRMAERASDLRYILKRGPKGVPEDFPGDIPVCSTFEEIEGIMFEEKV